MKKLLLIVGATAIACSSAVMAKTNIEKSVIVNASNNNKVLNAAIGKNSKASVGSTSIKNANIKKSVIVNASNNNKVLNAAIGKGSTADTGSIRIE